MLLLINNEHIFNEKDISNLEFVEYINYKEDTIYIERDTFNAFNMLKMNLHLDDIDIDIKDGYRSIEKQESIFLELLKKYSYDKALEIEDEPGYSDYHCGQSIGITIKINGEWIDNYEELLKCEKLFKKIHKKLKYFGFVVRYPIGRERITNHRYEPWHIRYVGEYVNDIKNSLEEYLKKGV